MTKLSVNINKVATIRNARGGNNPDVVKVALDCEKFGAQGITVHPRPDERHIRYQDVYDLKPVLRTEFNIEGNPIDKFNDLVLKVKPTQVTLVPDAPDQITSNAGWDTKKNLAFLTEIVGEFKEKGIRTSIFVNAEPEMVEYAAKAGADRVELYTEPYASAYAAGPEAAIAPFVEAAKVAKSFEPTVISITKEGKTVKASQLMKLMGLGVKSGDTVTVTAEGASEDAAIAAMEQFFQANL